MTVLRLRTWVLMAALGALAGCSPSKAPDGQASASAEVAKPAALAGTSPILQKPGLWEISTEVQGLPKGIVSQLCVDEALSGRMAEIGLKGMNGNTHCSQKNVVRTGSTLDIDSVCEMIGHTVTSHIHMEMVGDSEYHQTVTATTTPPMTGDGKSTTRITGKRTGDCPTDMKGGDMVMPGGMKMNMYDAVSRAAAANSGQKRIA
ncbi:MAG: DUF3617 family protein [Asticcacaulis sp.]|uniref:DUF3617 domain-containing protein n=1 Tax=Asticcacaulis sp. TaxID=1872648 RepID=UPI0039E22D82